MPKIKKFTADAISRLKLPPGREQIDFFQHLMPGRSLVLTLNKSGTRTWSALFYDKGSPRRKKLGSPPEMSCKDAREAALKFNATGELAKRRAGTFEAVAEQYLTRDVDERGLRSAHEIRRILKSNVYPNWGTKRFAEIGRRDVADLLDDISDRRGPGVADSTLAIIRALMNWFQKRDDDYVSPIVTGMRRGEAEPRERWLDDEEIRSLWQACEGASTFGAICRVLLLTGQRKSKVATMRWDDVDLDTGVWTIRREKREKGCAEAITLPRAALDIVGAQPPIAENDFVFAGRGGVAFNHWSESKQALDAKLNFDQDWRLHDLRRTCRALMTRAGVQTEIAERALGHSIKGIQGVYDRPKEYRPRIDQALRKVEAEVQKILEPERKVVQLR